MHMNTEENKDRIIGLDMLRILSMTLITVRHFVGYACLSDLVQTISVNGILIAVLKAMCGSAVNIFVLISGYFLTDSRFKWNRVLRIWGETIFYSVICFILSFVLGAEKPTAGKLMLSFFPLTTRHYWFSVAYLGVYLISTVLNKLINALSERDFSYIVVGGGVLLSAWTSVVFFSEGVLTGGNTGLLWFIYLYLVGAYLKRRQTVLPKTSYCVFWSVIIVLVLTVYQIAENRIGFLQNFNWLEDDSVFELLLSVLLFMAFLRVKVKSNAVQRTVIALAGCSFGVYLIQESCMLRQWLWQEFVCAQKYAEKWYLLLIAIAVVIALFTLAYLGHKIFQRVYSRIERFVTNKTVRMYKNNS